MSRPENVRCSAPADVHPVPFDALLVAASGEDLINAAAQLGNYDIDTKRTRILGTADWIAEDTGREPSLVGAWFATPPADSAAGFADKFRRMYETAPPPLATAAYDLVALAAILGSQEGGPKYDRETLTTDTGFAGVGGLFRFLNNGLSERSLEVREVETRGWDSVVECARAFERALHDRNVREQRRHAEAYRLQQERQAAVAPDEQEPLPEPQGPRMPMVLAHSVDRQRAGAKAKQRHAQHQQRERVERLTRHEALALARGGARPGHAHNSD